MSGTPPRPARPLPATPGVGEMLRRAFRLRCPRCGVGRLFVRRFTMDEVCGHCGLRYEREPGYFVGAIYVNYACTAAVCLGSAIAAEVVAGASLGVQLAIALPLALLVPIALFRHSRGLWLGVGHLLASADEVAERRRRRSRRRPG